MEKKATDWEIIFTKHVSVKDLDPEYVICKELSKTNNKKKPTKNRQKT